MHAVSPRSTAARLACLTVITVVISSASSAAIAPEAGIQTIEPNDNQHAAGALVGTTLTLALRAGYGLWHPEGPRGPGLEIEALGEAGTPLTVPAPLIRVREDTEIAVSIRNDLPAPLLVHGLCARDGSTCPVVEVPPSATREVRFTSGRAGTYHYWATTMGLPIPYRELSGAFIVDPPTGDVVPDRVLVITEWTSMTPQQLREVVTADDTGEAFVRIHPRVAFMINGLSWPATERLTYHLGDHVRWRIINLSTQSHPMHLHGFYFNVASMGDGLRDLPIDDDHARRVVTQVLPPGATMAIAWTPEREGNWLFHCHIMSHVSPDRRLAEPEMTTDTAHHHTDHDKSGGMASMVVGITVLGSPKPVASVAPSIDSPRRRLTLVMKCELTNDGSAPISGFVLSEGGMPPVSNYVTVPGPALLLRRNEPVEITLVNQLEEASAIHWHGMELDSIYDGVHGWSGIDQQLAPMIEPGGTFVVRFTPPRAGTFIYHTHVHDHRQLSSGMYGSMIVMDPGETFDPATDHVLVIGRVGVTSEIASVISDPSSVLLNGQRSPRFVWQAGTRHRVRLINITPDDIFSVSLQTPEGPVMWTPVTKDGAPVAAVTRIPGPARQMIAVGETYDFEYQTLPGRKTAWLEVRSTGGKWLLQSQVIIK